MLDPGERPRLTEDDLSELLNQVPPREINRWGDEGPIREESEEGRRKYKGLGEVSVPEGVLYIPEWLMRGEKPPRI